MSLTERLLVFYVVVRTFVAVILVSLTGRLLVFYVVVRTFVAMIIVSN